MPWCSQRMQITGRGRQVLEGEAVEQDCSGHNSRTRLEQAVAGKEWRAGWSRFVFQNYQWLQAMVFAIEKINRNPDLLPNITLGFQIYDSCAVLHLSLLGTLWMLTGQEQGKHILNYHCQRTGPLAGIIGDAGSSSSILMARVLGLYRQPQISYFSTNPLLSDRDQFPSFFRTIPSDDYQFRGLAQLVIHFDWTWVGLLAEDNDYGQHGIQIMQIELQKAGACVAFSESIILSQADRNANHIVQVIKNSTVNAIVVFGLDSRIEPLLHEMLRQDMSGKVFIASEAWSTSALLSVPQYFKILSGTIGFAVYSGEMQGFKEYISSVQPSNIQKDIFMKDFWETAFHCKWHDHEILLGSWDNQTKMCTGFESLDSVSGIYNDVTSPRVTYSVYRAVYAIVMALQELNSCWPKRGPFHQGTCANALDFHPWQLLHYIKGIHFQDEVESRPYFDDVGNPVARYDIVQWQLGANGAIEHKTVGHYESSPPAGNSLHINSSALQWTGHMKIPVSVCNPSCSPGFRKAAKEGQPTCCFMCIPCPQGEITNQTDSVQCSKCPWDYWSNWKHNKCILKPLEFLSYEDPLGAILAGISIFLSSVPAAILGLFIHSKGTPIVKANNRSLSYLLLLSLNLCFLCSLAFIGYPTPEKCLLRQASFGITFSLCISCILAKTIMVVLAFNATKPNSAIRRWIGPKLSYVVIGVCTLKQVVLCGSWLIISPPFLEYNINTQPGIIIVQCNEGSSVAFWCMLGYLGLLASICFLVAFMARRLPDSFNEAKFITFSMLAFLSVWLAFFPAYLSTKGKYMVAMEIFAMLSSSAALVSCIFFPKCFIILLRPEINSKDYLMGRNSGQQSKSIENR
ncbi:extracellular calcium-sensing receptor-like [Ambystoma mexicanum]|uniref:extracellular calcium-sensing receptor-like n=1 Tax=Ambystoma mexicanum TaxID=8296 RepID=UPI0037E942B7